MKVVFDHQIFGVQQYGGISRYFYEVATRLPSVGPFEVEVFAPLYVNQYFSRSSAVSPRGFKIREIRRAARTVRRVNVAVTQLALRRRRDVDILHETYYSRRDALPRNARRLLTVYDMIHERFASTFAPDDRTSDDKAYAVRRADHVICISENTRKDLIDIVGIPASKTSVVYLGHSLSSKRVIPFSSERPYLLYVGQRSTYKNFDGLVRAFAGSRMVSDGFSIVCVGSGALQPSELALIASVGIPQGRVIQVNGDDSVLAGCYASAAAFVYPSKYEGFGIPPLEAMALRCPTVCANSSSIPEVVGDASELFDPNDVASIREAIERVVYSSERSAELVAKGLERAAQFSWEKCARDSAAVYERVVGRAA